MRRLTPGRRATLEQAIARHGGVLAAMNATGACYEDVAEAKRGMHAACVTPAPAAARVPCGSLQAYRRHLKTGEPVDLVCLRAWTRSLQDAFIFDMCVGLT